MSSPAEWLLLTMTTFHRPHLPSQSSSPLSGKHTLSRLIHYTVFFASRLSCLSWKSTHTTGIFTFDMFPEKIDDISKYCICNCVLMVSALYENALASRPLCVTNVVYKCIWHMIWVWQRVSRVTSGIWSRPMAARPLVIIVSAKFMSG